MDESRDFRKLQIREFPKKTLRGTAEGRFWRKFKSVKAVQQPGAVTHVEFCDCAPHDLSVTSSTRVILYDGQTHSQKKVFSRFTDVAYSGSLRQDGKALVAGGETGIIQVLDAGSRLVLRQLKGHSRAVHFTRYAEDKVHIFSAGDDNTARWWDAASEESLLRLGGHTDYVRCGATGGASPDVWATGSYDHTVRLWDIRSGKCVMQLQHGRPLEDVSFFPSGGLFVSAGANYMSIWDMIAGGRLLKRVSNHQKTITSVQVSSLLGVATQSTVIGGEGPRLISASLDGHVKVYELDSFKTTHSSRYPAPILSMAVSPTLQTLAVGLSTGLLSIRKMKVQATEAKTELDMDAPWWKRRKEKNRHKTRYYQSNLDDETMETTDYEVARRKPVRFSEFDKLLKGFNHKEALIAAIECNHPDVVITVMEELIARRTLVTALAGHNAQTLKPLIFFLCKHIMDPRYAKLLLQIAHRVLDVYAEMLGLSEDIDFQVGVLRKAVLEEVKMQQSLQSLQGMLQALMPQATYGVAPITV